MNTTTCDKCGAEFVTGEKIWRDAMTHLRLYHVLGDQVATLLAGQCWVNPAATIPAHRAGWVTLQVKTSIHRAIVVKGREAWLLIEGERQRRLEQEAEQAENWRRRDDERRRHALKARPDQERVSMVARQLRAEHLRATTDQEHEQASRKGEWWYLPRPEDARIESREPEQMWHEYGPRFTPPLWAVLGPDDPTEVSAEADVITRSFSLPRGRRFDIEPTVLHERMWPTLDEQRGVCQ